ncbi:hypothetical protein ALP16_01600 [Pseudomonas savastanoi]|uniref:Uncharacterized protein n=1 Tax=Pseudomonas savastanoi TaxID=29438 RepID=A0A3M6ALD0_PSESS|nr:hypothetical protein ALP16_01600 [Pseudomonas savastanoi]
MVHERHEQRVEADHGSEAPLAQLLDEAADIARVGDQDVVIAADHHAHAVRRERIDVIERQRRNHHLLALFKQRSALRSLLAHAGIDLLHVGDQIAMGEHRAFGQPRGATGVLQNGNILQTSRYDLHAALAPQAQRALEADGLRQMEFGDHLLDLVDKGIDQPALGRRLHVAHFYFDQVFDGRVRQHFLHQLAEQVEVNQRSGTRVLELMAHLACGVQRVGVDHRQTGAHRTEYGDRILQDIGHLYGNAITRHQLSMLL